LETSLKKKKKVVLPELGHALGHTHTHQRKDRQEYIDIELEKMEFDKSVALNEVLTETPIPRYSGTNGERITLKYDVKSIMHYHYFSCQRVPGYHYFCVTTTEKGKAAGITSSDLFEPRDELSEGDVELFFRTAEMVAKRNGKTCPAMLRPEPSPEPGPETSPEPSPFA
jgi:hypothetical protein